MMLYSFVWWSSWFAVDKRTRLLSRRRFILYRYTARARTSFDIVNFVAIDSPIVPEFTGALAVNRYQLACPPERVPGNLARSPRHR